MTISKPLTINEKAFIVKKLMKTMSKHEIATELGVSISTIYRWLKLA